VLFPQSKASLVLLITGEIAVGILALALGVLSLPLVLLLILGGVILVYPLAGIVLMVFLMPQLTFLEVDLGNITVTAFRVVLALTVGSFVVRSLLNREKVISSPLDLPLILFLGLSIVSIIASSHKSAGVTRFVFLVSLFLTMIVIANLIRDERQLRVVITTLFISCAMTVLLVLLDVVAYQKVFFGGVHRLMGGSVGTIYSMPHALARDMNTFLPFVLLMLFHVSGGKRLLLIFLASAMVLILIMTSVLAGWLGAIAAVSTIFVFKLARKESFLRTKFVATSLLFIGLVAVTVFTFAPRQLVSYQFERFSRIFTNIEHFTSKTTRGYVWETAGRMFAENPILGVGLGGFPLEYPQYMVAEVGVQEKVLTKHGFNVFVDLGTEMGLLAIPLFLWFLIRLARYVVRYVTVVEDSYLGSVLLASFASSVAVFVHMQTETGPFWGNNFWCMIGLSLAAINVAKSKQVSSEEGKLKRRVYGK